MFPGLHPPCGFDVSWLSLVGNIGVILDASYLCPDCLRDVLWMESSMCPGNLSDV